MRRSVTICCLGVVLGAVLASSARADEKVDNPLYKHWAQFKVGSYAVLKSTTSVMGTKNETTITQTLKEVTADKLVIEVTIVAKVAGQVHKMPAQRQEVQAKVDKAKAKEHVDPKGKVKEGKETLKIAGKKLETRWVETKIEERGMVLTMTAWTCDDVPGQIVKSITTTKGPQGMKTDTILAEFKAIKK